MTGGTRGWKCPAQSFDVRLSSAYDFGRMDDSQELEYLDMRSTRLTQVNAEVTYTPDGLAEERRGVKTPLEDEVEDAMATLGRWAARRGARVYAWRLLGMVHADGNALRTPLVRMAVVPKQWDRLRYGHGSPGLAPLSRTPFCRVERHKVTAHLKDDGTVVITEA